MTVLPGERPNLMEIEKIMSVYTLLLRVLLAVTSVISLQVHAEDKQSYEAQAAEGAEQEMTWIQKAREGDVQAAFNLGYTYYTQQNYSGALRWYGKAAELGNARAAFEIAILYRDGDVGEPDEKIMISYLQQAAKRGLDLAQMELGFSYLQGTGVEQDVMKAMYWYEQAAKQGNAEAQYTLSTLYWTDTRGIEQAAMEADGSMNEMDAAYSSNDRKAAYWLCQAALQHHGQAQFTLSQIYGSGDHNVAVDSKQSRLWLQNAANSGLEEAETELLDVNDPWYASFGVWASEFLGRSPENATCPNIAII